MQQKNEPYVYVYRRLKVCLYDSQQYTPRGSAKAIELVII